MNSQVDYQQLLRALELPTPEHVTKFSSLGLEVFHAGLGTADPRLDPCMGIDHSLERARLKVTMELLERRLLRLVYQDPQLVFDVGAGTVNSSFIVSNPYSAEQMQRFPELRAAWLKRDLSSVSGVDALDGERVVSLPLYALVGCNPPAIYEHSSNGWAIGDDAAVEERAILELIERDAFLYCWWTKRSPRRIIGFEKTSAVYQRFKSWANQQGADLDLLLIPSESGAPVVAATIRAEDGVLPYFLVALGASLSFKCAAEKAVLELVGLLSAPLEPGLAKKYFYPESFDDNVFTLQHHVMTYALWSDRSAYDFLYGSTDIVSIAEDVSLTQVVENLRALGHDLFLFRSKSSLLDLPSLRLVRAFSTSLLPLDIQHRRRPLGHPRLKGQIFNQFPHPIG